MTPTEAKQIIDKARSVINDLKARNAKLRRAVEMERHARVKWERLARQGERR